MALSQKTPFFDQHKKNNAKIVDFGGWLLPVQYTRIQDEHQAVRQRAGLFDASHMGEFLVTGRDAEKFVDYILTNTVLNKKPYKAIYSPMLNEKGGFVDDLILYKYNRDKLMLVVNASNIEKDLRWIKSRTSSHVFFDAKIQDLSEETCLLAVQGPASQRILERLVRHSGELRQLQPFSFYEDNITNVQVIVARSGYTGELGYELYFNRQFAVKIWNFISEEGRRHGMAYCGLGARDSLRLEKCYLLYGNDMGETVTPFEADVRWTVNLKKEFVGKDSLMKQPVTRKLTAFEMLEDRIPRHEYPIFAEDGTTELGKVTSGGVSFTLKKNIGMGYVPLDYTQPGKIIKIKIREQMVPAKVVEKPFVKDK
jgi:aminomethyltransferase